MKRFKRYFKNLMNPFFNAPEREAKPIYVRIEPRIERFKNKK